MKYNLNLSIDKERAINYFQKLIEAGAIIELKTSKERSKEQWGYLHLILAWFGVQKGYTMNEVKQSFYKQEANKEIFQIVKEGKCGIIIKWRSSSDLDSAELTKSIDRFRTWASLEPRCIYLPEPNEKEKLAWMQSEIDKEDIVSM